MHTVLYFLKNYLQTTYIYSTSIFEKNRKCLLTLGIEIELCSFDDSNVRVPVIGIKWQNVTLFH
jgi:hypothetical protein